ncbi:hypothetical protein J3E64_000244 [Sphingobium sp. OAS761]|uniref:GldG family protein n=1 Tax=Sphingobium sp. OAS761 TaxID=2817901 RepID=UPI00209D9ADD|nr:GldG family protein [Sphingobium sp. OAS761]MCP1468577.1 hypothetical protein [Sphingobium sp. OAS761]
MTTAGAMTAIRAGLGRFLGLWVPMLLVLLAGLARAWLTGQADPWDWAGAALAVLALTGLISATHGTPLLVWAALGVCGSVLLFCAFAAMRLPDGPAAAGIVFVALLAVLGGAWLRAPPGRVTVALERHRAWSRLSGLALLAMAALLQWRGPVQPLRPAAERPLLAILTGLPLFWAEPGRDGTGPRDAPITAVLRTRFSLLPIDDPAALVPSRARLLLLAQPRALPPEGLVAIDRWVRAGGTALVLADPLLDWPSTLPPGDRRRPPPTSLIAPMLAHWGFARSGQDDTEKRHFLPDGGLLVLSGTDLFDALPARRKVGRGSVLLVGDADLIDDRLWLADPARPLDPRAWSAETPARLARWLGAGMPRPRRWMRDGDAVVLALRAAFLAGTIWAILGSMMFRPAFHARWWIPQTREKTEKTD